MQNEGVVVRTVLLFLLSAPGLAGFARLNTATAAAFDRYVELTEARMNENLDGRKFLNLDDDERSKLRAGEVRIEAGRTLDHGKDIDVPHGMIQDWIGTMFLPNATIDSVRRVLQDYPNYKNYYRPDVIDSKQLGRNGDEYDVFLRLYKHQILTVVLNTNYHVRYVTPDPKRMYVISRSTRIAEVKDSKGPYTAEEPVGNDTGFLWRLNSYWHFEEADGGVYARCQAISLSRDVPLGLGFMLKGFLQKFPKESMTNTLYGTKAAVGQH